MVWTRFLFSNCCLVCIKIKPINIVLNNCLISGNLFCNWLVMIFFSFCILLAMVYSDFFSYDQYSLYFKQKQLGDKRTSLFAESEKTRPTAVHNYLTRVQKGRGRDGTWKVVSNIISRLGYHNQFGQVGKYKFSYVLRTLTSLCWLLYFILYIILNCFPAIYKTMGDVILHILHIYPKKKILNIFVVGWIIMKNMKTVSKSNSIKCKH